MPGASPSRAAVVAFATAAAALIFTSVHAETGPRWRPRDRSELVLVLPDAPAPVPAGAGGGAAPTDPVRVAEQAEAFIAVARRTNDARWFGRAEALVEPWVARPDAPARLLAAAADVAQQRHDFNAARGFFDRALAADPGNAGARLQRANVALLLGDFSAARSDCRAVLMAGNAFAGTTCLASAATGPGSVARARKLLAALERQRGAPPELARWQLLTAADLASRDGDAGSALQFLTRAQALDPAHEETRARLAALLVDRGDAKSALALTAGDNVSAALLVVRLRAASGIDATVALAARRELDALLEVGRLRGTVAHLREAGELALRADRDPRRALALARENFAVQKDTPDLRLFVDAAVAARDHATIRYLQDWMAATGFEDRVATSRLARAGA